MTPFVISPTKNRRRNKKQKGAPQQQQQQQHPITNLPTSTPLKSCLKDSKKEANNNKTPTTEKRQPRRRVQFGQVHVQYHDYELSDNPAVSYGAAVSIKWKSFASMTTTVYEHEEHKNRLGDGSYQQQCPLLSSSERYDRLRRAGYTLDEIEESAKRSKETKQQRERSSVRDSTTNLLTRSKLRRTSLFQSPIKHQHHQQRMKSTTTRPSVKKKQNHDHHHPDNLTKVWSPWVVAL